MRLWLNTCYRRGLAYENISASGPNGGEPSHRTGHIAVLTSPSSALPHYIPVKGADRIIDSETPYVM